MVEAHKDPVWTNQSYLPGFPHSPVHHPVVLGQRAAHMALAEEAHHPAYVVARVKVHGRSRQTRACPALASAPWV